jgi:hypothetical protein
MVAIRLGLKRKQRGGTPTPADELAVVLRGRGRDVILASIEGFLRPRIERYRQGPESSRRADPQVGRMRCEVLERGALPS